MLYSIVFNGPFWYECEWHLTIRNVEDGFDGDDKLLTANDKMHTIGIVVIVFFSGDISQRCIKPNSLYTSTSIYTISSNSTTWVPRETTWTLNRDNRRDVFIPTDVPPVFDWLINLYYKGTIDA